MSKSRLEKAQSNSSFLERFKGKTNTVSKHGLNQLFKTNNNAIQRFRMTRQSKTKVIQQKNQIQSIDLDEILPQNPKMQRIPSLKNQLGSTNASRLSGINSVTRKGSQTSIYVPSIYNLPQVKDISKQITKKILSRIAFNDTKVASDHRDSGSNCPTNNNSGLAFYQKFNLDEEAQQHIRCLDKLNKQKNRQFYYKLETR